MGFISYAKKNPGYTFHPKNPALQDSILVFNQDCELVSQLPNHLTQGGVCLPDFHLFYSSCNHSANDLFLKYDIQDQDRQYT